MSKAAVPTMKVSDAVGLQGPNFSRKGPNLESSFNHPSVSQISRRHSWTANSCLAIQDRLLTPDIMDVSVARPSGDSMPHMQESLLCNKRVFAGARSSATYDMAYFLKHTGPPINVREAPKDEPRKSIRKKNRGIFKKRRDLPDLVTPNVDVQSPFVFVPPEGVEQKVTARGHKYLQIVPQADLFEPGRIYSPRLFCNPMEENTEAITSDTLDIWISSLDAQQEDGTSGVKPPAIEDMRAHEIGDSPPPSRPKTPSSFHSETRAALPPAVGGFGLSIIDDQIVGTISPGASGGSPVLCSNPPSDSGSSGRGVPCHNDSLESAHLPLLEKRVDSAECRQISNQPEQSSSVVRANREKYDGRFPDVLAGRSQKKPGRDKIVRTRSETDLFPTKAIELHSNRDAVLQARKLRATQQSGQDVNAMAVGAAQFGGAHSGDCGHNDESNAAKEKASFETLSAAVGPSQQNQVAKIMLVAEQVPLLGRRPTRRPARLDLQDGYASHGAAAVRSDDSRVTPVASSPSTVLQGKQKAYPPLQAPNIPAKSTARTTPPPTAVSATSPQTQRYSMLRPSSPILPPQAVTATTALTGAVRASVSSSHTSPSREARLEARVDALERENRLLEAALMAVLKTAGTLNRCPCIVLKEHADAHVRHSGHLAVSRPQTLTLLPSRASTPLPKLPGTELQRVREEGAREAVAAKAPSSSASSTHTRRGSADSSGSGVSALEVYLRTKIGG